MYSVYDQIYTAFGSPDSNSLKIISNVFFKKPKNVSNRSMLLIIELINRVTFNSFFGLYGSVFKIPYTLIYSIKKFLIWCLE